jgi:flagellar basal-body rod protein FlgB
VRASEAEGQARVRDEQARVSIPHDTWINETPKHESEAKIKIPFRFRRTPAAQPLKFATSPADNFNMDAPIYGLGTLTHLLQSAGVRHRVIAQNVANVNTPGYRRLEVSFGEELTRALKHGTPLPAPTIVESDAPDRVDGNTVDIDRELGDLNKNALLYQTAVGILNSRLNSLRSAISGR